MSRLEVVLGCERLDHHLTRLTENGYKVTLSAKYHIIDLVEVLT